MSNPYPPPPPPGGQDPNQPPAGGTPPPPPPPPPGAPGTPPAYGGYPPPDQYGQPPAYPPPGAPGGYGGPATPKSNVLAIVSLVTGILGVLCCGSAVFSVAALVCGFLGRKQIEESAGTQKGSGMALAGLILGAVGVVLAVIYWILLASGAIHYNFTTSP